MDTQPLLRVNNVKSPAASTATARSDNNEGGGRDFDRHLQDQVQQADTAKNTSKPAEKAVSQSDTEASSQITRADQDADITEENLDQDAVGVVAGMPLELLSDDEIVLEANTLPGDMVEQGLPQDGNALPLLPADMAARGADIVSDNNGDKVMPDGDSAELIRLLKEQSGVKLKQADNAPENELDLKTAVQLAELKPVSKSAEEISDKQLATLFMEGNKATAVMTQQVQSVAGAATVNIQNYSQPQMNVAQAQAGVFNGSINTPPGHPAWGNQVGDQLAYMIRGNVHSAEIKLNPAHLGPMEIHLTMKDHNASVTFVSAHAPVREALDAAMPRLRDLMEQQGLNLLNVDVSAHSGGQRHEAFEQASNPSGIISNEQQNQPASATTIVHARIETGLSVFA